jgi:ACS family hexuronate transporter-like MFS transporter
MNSLKSAKQDLNRLPRGIRGAGHVRWWIVWTLFFSTVTNYISRQTFSVLAPMLAAQYHFSHTDIAKILGAFQISYAATWLLGGIFLDTFGTRLGLALAVSFWSIVNIVTGFANSGFGFAISRFLLGFGEGFNWPGASKTVAEWFPDDERGVAVAIFDSGSERWRSAGGHDHSMDRNCFWVAMVLCILGRARIRLVDDVALHLSSAR